MQDKYPEHQKLSKVKEQSQWLGAFIEWLQLEKQWDICEYTEDTNESHRVIIDINTLLAEYLEVDLVKLEEEKQQMLNEIRELNKYSWIQPGVTVWYTNMLLLASSGTVKEVRGGGIQIVLESGQILTKEQCYKTEQEADKR